MEVKTFTLGELQTNCYLVRGLIIDPGDEANFISEQILRLGIKPVAIVATHGHFDHILAANELQLAFRIPFLIHPKDLFLVKNLQKNASFWTERRIVERGPGEIGDLRDFGGVGGDGGFGGLKVIQTPGHTPGSVCQGRLDKRENLDYNRFRFNKKKMTNRLSRYPADVNVESPAEARCQVGGFMDLAPGERDKTVPMRGGCCQRTERECRVLAVVGCDKRLPPLAGEREKPAS
jgi:hypothetical protein